MELAAKLAMWTASWPTVTRRLTLLALATLPQGKVLVTFVPPGSLSGWTLPWVKAEASQTTPNPPVGFPLLWRREAHCQAPRALLTPGPPAVPLRVLIRLTSLCILFACFCDGFRCVSFQLAPQATLPSQLSS